MTHFPTREEFAETRTILTGVLCFSLAFTILSCFIPVTRFSFIVMTLALILCILACLYQEYRQFGSIILPPKPEMPKKNIDDEDEDSDEDSEDSKNPTGDADKE
jgi:hypothetical protein